MNTFLKFLSVLLCLIVVNKEINAYSDQQKAEAVIAKLTDFTQKLQLKINALDTVLSELTSKKTPLELKDVQRAFIKFKSTIFSDTFVAMLPSFQDIIGDEAAVAEGLELSKTQAAAKK